MGSFVKQTNKINHHPQQQKERSYPHDTGMTFILKRVHFITIKSSLYHKSSPTTPPPPSTLAPHPQKQRNKQHLSCCLLFCNFYSDLEFSFCRLKIHLLIFFEVFLKMFHGHNKGSCKQLLDEVFVILRIIKVEVGVICRSRRLY